MPRSIKALAAALMVGLGVAPLSADVRLRLALNSPEMVGPTGKVAGGHEQGTILIGQDRVRDSKGQSASILRKDTHTLYWIKTSTAKVYCQYRFPLVLKDEFPPDLIDNLQRYPHDEGPAVVKVTPLGPRTVGRWRTTGTRIEVSDAPESWKKVSVWTTEELKEVPFYLINELRLALAPLYRSRPELALAQELAKVSGVPVRVEIESKSRMSDQVIHSDEQIEAVDEVQTQESDYLPARGTKRASNLQCF